MCKSSMNWNKLYNKLREEPYYDNDDSINPMERNTMTIKYIYIIYIYILYKWYVHTKCICINNIYISISVHCANYLGTIRCTSPGCLFVKNCPVNSLQPFAMEFVRW